MFCYYGFEACGDVAEETPDASRTIPKAIRMTIYVEKDSQKGILIGAAGAMLKRIGSGARRGIEEMLGRQAYLELIGA